jgi:hypothetical protein
VLHVAAAGVVDDLDQRLGPFDGRCRRSSCPATRYILLAADLGEVGERLVVLVLRPALERMVVALVAVEPHGQEQVRGVLHRLVRLAEIL